MTQTGINNKRILAFVITYYPDEQLLRDNIRSFASDVDRIVIWDNTPEGDVTIKSIVDEYKHATYLTEGCNKGISYPLNRAWRLACSEYYDYLLTMDQDSVWKDFRLYKDSIFSKNAPWGIYGPEVRLPKVQSRPYFEKTDYVITSGMLVSADILNRLDGYCQEFFVDGIDIEFCLYAKKYGIPTYRLKHCYMKQRFGTPQTTIVLGCKQHTTNYSPRRLHEIGKVHTSIFLHYPCSFTLRKKIIMTYLWKFPIKLFFLESDKKNKAMAFLQGLWKGLHCQKIRNNSYYLVVIFLICTFASWIH